MLEKDFSYSEANDIVDLLISNLTKNEILQLFDLFKKNVIFFANEESLFKDADSSLFTLLDHVTKKELTAGMKKLRPDLMDKINYILAKKKT